MSIYLSIVVPLFNEEESVEKLVSKIEEAATDFGYGYEIVLVDDGSTDHTWDKIELLSGTMPHLKGVKFRRNYGQTPAMVAGFEYSSGKVIVTMDGDLQNDPADIPKLITELEKGYDIVSGWRKFRKDHFSRVLPSKIANYIISKTTGVFLHDYGCSLKAYRAECIKSLKAYGEMHRFFPALASMTGARVTEIPVNHHARRYGVSKYGFDRIFKVFSDIFSMNLIIRFSSMPLKGFAVCAFPFFLLTIFFMIFAILAFSFNWSEGKDVLFLFIAVLNGMVVVNLFVLGIVGELIVESSDLSHAAMPEITKRFIDMIQKSN